MVRYFVYDKNSELEHGSFDNYEDAKECYDNEVVTEEDRKRLELVKEYVDEEIMEVLISYEE